MIIMAIGLAAALLPVQYVMPLLELSLYLAIMLLLPMVLLDVKGLFNNL